MRVMRFVLFLLSCSALILITRLATLLIFTEAQTGILSLTSLILSFRSPVDITLSAIPSRSVATMRLSLSPLHDCTLPEPAPSFFPFPHAGSYTSPLCPCALSCCFICGISFVFLAVTGPMHAVRSEFCGLGPRRIAKEGSIDSD